MTPVGLPRPEQLPGADDGLTGPLIVLDPRQPPPSSSSTTRVAVTHDRWFARSFDRFLIFTPDGDVREATEPAWD